MNEYTPEKVAKLVAEARGRAGEDMGLSDQLLRELSDALTAVSAERDALRGPDSDDRDELITAPIIRALQVAKAERDRLHKAITEADRILRAALDKEGNDGD